MSFTRTAAAFVLLCGLAWPRALPAAPRKALPKKIDISKFRDHLIVLHDKKGHYFVVPNLLDKGVMGTRARVRSRVFNVRDAVFYGDGKRFYLQRSPNKGRNPPRFSIVFFDPRARQPRFSIFQYRPPEAGGASFSCDDRKTPLLELDGTQRTRILDKAAFHERYWRRRPHLLARDDDGVYFYVDRRDVSTADGVLMQAIDLKDFRFWAGKRGRMKRLKLNDVIVDPAGQVFITKQGKLRVESKKQRYLWQVGAKHVALTHVPLTAYNGGLVLLYRQLGPYLGQRLGRPCDDL